MAWQKEGNKTSVKVGQIIFMENKQLSINLFASIVAYVVQYAISLVLTPYIIKELGVDGYGFVGLSTQIIGYSSLITIALNSMASRFISIEYYKGNIVNANKYFSSVFLGNIIIGTIIIIFSCILVVYLDIFINIPKNLVSDVKILFAFLSLNSVLGILANVYAVSTFIKNRLDYANVRNIIGNIIRAFVLLCCYSFFVPKVWYFGFTSIICTIYIFITNYKFTRRLTPDLYVRKDCFEKTYIKNLVLSGSWNVLTRLSRIFEDGLNLLVANLFVGAKLAGTLALSMTVPTMVNSVCAMMASNFAPSWTKLYANDDKDLMLKEVLKSIRIMSFFTSIPIAVFYVYGKTFFSLWTPSENAEELYWLSVAGSFVMLFAMPLESLWNVFTITNQVKKSSINLLENSVVMFVIVMIGIFVVEDNMIRLFIIASTKSIVATIRTLTFLTIQSAKCLKYPAFTFYPPVFRNILCVVLTCLISRYIKDFAISNSWGGLIIGSGITCMIGFVLNYFVALSKTDRAYIKAKTQVYICAMCEKR